LFRARGLLRESLSRELDMTVADVFQFGGEHCDRLAARVLARLRGAVTSAGHEPEGPTIEPLGNTRPWVR
jgi:hypothetical protein